MNIIRFCRYWSDFSVVLTAVLCFRNSWVNWSRRRFNWTSSNRRWTICWKTNTQRPIRSRWARLVSNTLLLCFYPCRCVSHSVWLCCSGLHGDAADAVELASSDHQMHQRPPEGKCTIQPGWNKQIKHFWCFFAFWSEFLYIVMVCSPQFFKEASDMNSKLQKEHDNIRKNFSCDKSTPLHNLLELLQGLEVTLQSGFNMY